MSKKNQKLNLYVWTGFNTDGLAVAIASSLTKAKKMVQQKQPVNCWGELSIHDLYTTFAVAVGGDD